MEDKKSFEELLEELLMAVAEQTSTVFEAVMGARNVAEQEQANEKVDTLKSAVLSSYYDASYQEMLQQIKNSIIGEKNNKPPK